MITHCQICKRKFWDEDDEVHPLPGDPRYCQECAIKACERMEKEIGKRNKIPSTSQIPTGGGWGRSRIRRHIKEEKP